MQDVGDRGKSKEKKLHLRPPVTYLLLAHSRKSDITLEVQIIKRFI